MSIDKQLEDRHYVISYDARYGWFAHSYPSYPAVGTYLVEARGTTPQAALSNLLEEHVHLALADLED